MVVVASPPIEINRIGSSASLGVWSERLTSRYINAWDSLKEISFVNANSGTTGDGEGNGVSATESGRLAHPATNAAITKANKL